MIKVFVGESAESMGDAVAQAEQALAEFTRAHPYLSIPTQISTTATTTCDTGFCCWHFTFTLTVLIPC